MIFVLVLDEVQLDNKRSYSQSGAQLGSKHMTKLGGTVLRSWTVAVSTVFAYRELS